MLNKEILHNSLYQKKLFLVKDKRNSKKFYQRFSDILDIEILRREDFWGKNDIAVFDYLQECIIDNWTYEEWFHVFMEKTVQEMINKISIKKTFCVIKQKDINILSCIDAFDRGNEIINITDEENQFKFFFNKNDFYRNVFNFKSIPKRKNILIENVHNNKNKNWAMHFIQSGLRELPVLYKGCVKEIATTRTVAKLDLNWDLINEKILHVYFYKYCMLVLSSRCKELDKFYHRYKNELNIVFLEEELLKKRNISTNVLLITNSDDQGRLFSGSLTIYQIYLDLISWSLTEKMKTKKIKYFYFERPLDSEINNREKRWADQIDKIFFPQSIFKNGYYQAKDLFSKECNVIDGMRHTCNCPEHFYNTIWFFGPCIVAGINVTDEETMESQLQKKIRRDFIQYRVVNCGQHGIGEGIRTDINSFYRMADTYFREGDVIIHFGMKTWNGKISNKIKHYYNTSQIYNKNFQGNYFVSGVAPHLNKQGYAILTNYIFDIIHSSLKRNVNVLTDCQIVKLSDYDCMDQKMKKEIMSYVNQIKKKQQSLKIQGVVGCIIMNANPLTNGHAFLIEESLKSVDFLYVFVVEEDRSFFKFNERYEMVKKYCQKFDNVCVFPSGKYMISSKTFGEYFNKELLQEENIMPVLDAEIFGKYISKELNIRVRFVGEEPFDRVTRQYNEILKYILPIYGVQVVEKVRCKINGRIVSASQVRIKMKQKEYSVIRKMIPESSMQYVMRYLEY